MIRRHPKGHAIWSWAIEWNHSIRVVGFAGDDDAIKTLVSSAPDEPRQLIYDAGNERVTVREEVPLPEHEDELFKIYIQRRDNASGL